jgi:hypothetical protein
MPVRQKVTSFMQGPNTWSPEQGVDAGAKGEKEKQKPTDEPETYYIRYILWRFIQLTCHLSMWLTSDKRCIHHVHVSRTVGETATCQLHSSRPPTYQFIQRNILEHYNADLKPKNISRNWTVITSVWQNWSTSVHSEIHYCVERHVVYPLLQCYNFWQEIRKILNTAVCL